MGVRFGVLLVIIWCCEAKYLYVGNVNNDGSNNMYKSGADGWEKWAKECDALGTYCAGFDSMGYIKSSVNNLQQNTGTTVWIKTDGPAPAPQVKIWPLPKSYSHGKDLVPLSASTSFTSNVNSEILKKAIARYRDLIFNEIIAEEQEDVLNINKISQAQRKEALPQLSTVTLNVASSSETLQLETDESYSLAISTSGVVITAKTIYGAMYGLETFSQLVHFNYTAKEYQIPDCPWNIQDRPQFPHRGVLIDTGRHYQPVSSIKKIIDSLSYAKLNTLHWHIVDAQSFPMESVKYPKLWDGAWSYKERYTQATIKNLVQYAKERGVRIMPEFDGPGHAYSWGVGYPEILPANYGASPSCESTCPTNPCDVPIDPSNEFTFQVVSGLFSEVTGGKREAGLFPFDFLHLGGDEVEPGCWNESAQIAEFLKKNKLTFDGLYKYYVNRTAQIALSYGRTPVHWEEVFNHFGKQLDPKTIIHIWLDHSTLADVVSAGYRGILSDNDNWYLDHLDVPWTTFYLNDPYLNISDAQRSLVIGAEVCMWGETVDPTDALQRIWPRSAAFAERVWNYDSANLDGAVELALPRLSRFRCLLLERGIDTAPVYSFTPNQPGGCANQ